MSDSISKTIDFIHICIYDNITLAISLNGPLRLKWDPLLIMGTLLKHFFFGFATSSSVTNLNKKFVLLSHLSGRSLHFARDQYL